MVQAVPLPEEDFTVLEGARVLIVQALFYKDLADELLKGAKGVLAGIAAHVDVIDVYGALELAPAVAIAMEYGPRYDAVVALGTVIRGETSHYDIVANESARALLDLSIKYTLPLGNGILTVENEEQAWARARDADKGGFAARAALSLLRAKRRIANGIDG